MTKITAISLTQPWASLCTLVNPATGKAEKSVETRSWKSQHTGELLIHASKGFPQEARDLCEEEPFKSALARHGIFSWKDLPLGAILGGTTMIGCLPTNRKHELNLAVPEGSNEHAFGDYSKNRFGFLLQEAWRFEKPVECSGKLSLWVVPDTVVATLSKTLFTAPPCFRCRGVGSKTVGNRSVSCDACEGRGYRVQSVFSRGDVANIYTPEIAVSGDSSG